MTLEEKDKELVQLALEIATRRFSEFSTVGCALRTKNGKIYTAVNIEQIHSSPCSMCAEYAAIAKMHSEEDQEIDTIVATGLGERILPPCGKCREMIKQFGNPFVILKKGNELFKVNLDELIPYWEL